FSYREISRPLLTALAASDPSEYNFSSVDNFYRALIRGDLSGEQDIRVNASKYGIALYTLRYIIIARSASPVTRKLLTELSCAIDSASDIQSCCLAADKQNAALIICRISNPEAFESEYAATVQQIFDSI